MYLCIGRVFGRRCQGNIFEVDLYTGNAYGDVEVVTQQAAFTTMVRSKKERNERKWKNDHAVDTLR